jgi:hypothetical protein
MKVFFYLPFSLTTLDVAPLSATAECLDSSRTPFHFVDAVDLFITLIALLVEWASWRSIIG